MWRRFDRSDPRHQSVKDAIDRLLLRGEHVCITAQNLIEFQSVATRPTAVSGLGFTPSEASRMAEDIRSSFSFLADTAAVYLHWRTLVNKYDVKGRQVHDARLVAVMLSYDITHFLTLNPIDFQRFKEIVVDEPANLS